MGSVDWGSVPDWLAAIGGVGAVCAAVLVALSEGRRAERAERARAADLDREHDDLVDAMAETGYMALDGVRGARTIMLSVAAPTDLPVIDFTGRRMGFEFPKMVVLESCGKAQRNLEFLMQTFTTDVRLRNAGEGYLGIFKSVEEKLSSADDFDDLLLTLDKLEMNFELSLPRILERRRHPLAVSRDPKTE